MNYNNDEMSDRPSGRVLALYNSPTGRPIGKPIRNYKPIIVFYIQLEAIRAIN